MTAALSHGDIVLLLAQALLVALQAAWLTIGSYSNLRWPRTNQDSVTNVVTMELTKERPGVYEDHKHRALSDPKAIGFLFHSVGLIEAAVAGLLWLAAGALFLVVPGLLAADVARSLALLAVLAFSVFLMVRRPPRSTLFPCATLLRSMS